MERWLESLHSDGTDVFASPASPKLDEWVTLSLRVIADHPIREVFLRTAPDGEQLLFPMKKRRKGSFDWYTSKIKVESPVLRYRFKIVCDDRTYWYTSAGVYFHTPADDTDFQLIANFQAPSWLSSRIFYQIFPDTFCNGDPSIDPRPDAYEYLGKRPLLRPWGTPPGEYRESRSMDFFGGDLKGIRDKLSYLQRLGVNALYLTPIFQAPSNHRYDVQDYFRIDPCLGTNEYFAEWVAYLHRMDFRVMLDGVFNHTGIACRWFNKCGYYPEPGAYQSMESPYAEFYTFLKHPERYFCWLTVDVLPKLNYRSEKLREMIYKGERSVMRYWLDPPYSIDGWRLDVANMIARQGAYQAHREVFREMRQAVKSAHPDCYFMGEHFFDATELLQGDALDGVMNYLGFCLPVREWLSGQKQGDAKSQSIKNPFTASDLDEQLTRIRAKIGWQIAQMQYNLIDCHDLPRLSGLLERPEGNLLAAVLLLTYLGVPSIYYGDEIGMESDRTVESARQPMVWDPSRWDMKRWESYRSLIRLRNESEAIRQGSFKSLYAQGDVYGYARFYRKETVLVVLNRGKAKTIRLDGGILGIGSGEEWTEFFTGQRIIGGERGTLELLVPAGQAMILRHGKGFSPGR